jgi:hypothetical protein
MEEELIVKGLLDQDSFYYVSIVNDSYMDGYDQLIQIVEDNGFQVKETYKDISVLVHAVKK